MDDFCICNVTIVSLKRNEYLYNYVQHQSFDKEQLPSHIVKKYVPNKKMFGAIFMMILSITMLFSFRYSNIVSLNEIVDTATHILNPIDPLFSDIGDIVFTNGLNIVRLKNRELNFVVPVIYDNATINDNGIEFDVTANPVLVAIESGVVSDIYVDQNNIKCIKIKHTKDCFSIMKNVGILGVHIGAVVTKGKNIGTVKLPSKINLSIEINGDTKPLIIDGNSICVK